MDFLDDASFNEAVRFAVQVLALLVCMLSLSNLWDMRSQVNNARAEVERLKWELSRSDLGFVLVDNACLNDFLRDNPDAITFADCERAKELCDGDGPRLFDRALDVLTMLGPPRPGKTVIFTRPAPPTGTRKRLSSHCRTGLTC